MLFTKSEITITSPHLSRFVFNAFVCGSSNQEAYEHSIAFATDHSPSKPLMICADAGMGKTHLAVAIGHALMDETADLSICYCTRMKFEEDVQKFLKINQLDVLVNWFSSRDLLIFDDIDELTERGPARKTFLRIFEQLCVQERRTVITVSHDMEDRNKKFLRYPRQNCTFALVEAPCVETRLATLSRLNNHEGQPLPKDVILYLCGLKDISLKKLCDFIVILTTYSIYADVVIDIDLTKKLLLDR